MDFKKLGKALLFPHVAIIIILLPLATAMLVCSMVFIGTDAIISYISYVLAAYTLTVVCLRIPRMIAFFKSFKQDNKYARRLSEDTHLRVNLSLYGSFVWMYSFRLHNLQLFLR